ncbi:tyrosine-type recombinase/integrase, partial [Paenibacillus glucanolyticus]
MANIQKRGGNSWFLTVSLGKDHQGKYIRRTKTVTCRTKKEAESEYAKFRQEVEAGEYIAPQKMTFGAFVEEWRDKYAVKHLGYKTLYTYESNLKIRILPAFQYMHLEDIKPLHIVNFLDKLEKEGSRGDKKSGGLASGTIEINHRILKNILKHAVEWRIIKRNPVSDVQKPKVNSKEIIPYDESEVDFDTGVLDVSQSMIHALKGEIIVKQPKTKKSTRNVALPSSVLKELKEYYEYRIQERNDIGDQWYGGNWFFMFSHPHGQPFHHERPYQWFRHFVKKSGFRYIRFHDLRHTSATILINQGVHAK